MNPIYKRSILIGLASIPAIVILFLLSAYMAYLEMQEYNRIPRNYDSFMVGIAPWAFFLLALLVILAVLGALAAWASRRVIKSIRGTILASSLAAGVPLSMATVLILFILLITFINTPERYQNLFGTQFSLFFLYLLYALTGLMLSIAGGVAYAVLARLFLRSKDRARS